MVRDTNLWLIYQVEARTGYGGGYNERGIVEYRRREPSSDDEYDEFGRKKRKRKADSLDKVGSCVSHLLLLHNVEHIPTFDHSK